MPANETKNQIAWFGINKKLSFVEQINRAGEFSITADEIKNISGREPRLMAKFDHGINRPDIFKKNNISILPITGSAYNLLKFDSFQNVQYGDNFKIVNAHTLKNYETIDLNDIRSEDKAIIIADLSGMLSRFTGEKNIRLTNKGKFGVEKFSFKINTLQGIKNISVNGVGAELDAGFEADKFYLIEAKLGKIEDFNIRQLYYPFRYWVEKIKKEVVPAIFTYSDNMFSFWEFKFEQKDNFHSIALVRHENYVLEYDEQANWSEILTINSFGDSNPEGVPFPQADDFEKVINILELVNSGTNIKENFADYFAFDKRQADYYFNAAKYLDLVNISKGQIYLTELGQKIISLSRSKRHAELIRLILTRKVFYDTFKFFKESDNNIGINEVVEIMKKNRVLRNSTEKMYGRRAQTILSWCKWIDKTLNELKKNG